MRPKTWAASLAPVILGTALAKHFGHFDPLIFLATLLTALSIQIGTNFANDYFDFKKGGDTERRIGPRRIMQKALVGEQEMIKAIAIAFLSAAFFCSYLYLKGGMVILLLLILAVLLGIGYTAGPIALAYLGLGDIVVLSSFGSLATGMTTYLQMGNYSPEEFIFGLAPGALSPAILVVNNLRDYETDLEADKKTLVVRFGRTFGRWEYALLFFLSQATPAYLRFSYSLCWKLSLLHVFIIPAIPLLKEVFRAKEPQDFAPLLPKTALYLMLYTLAGAYALLI